MSNIKTFGSVDQRSLDQLKRCMEAGDAAFGVLCADHHPGYSQPIGGGIAYEGYVSPSGVGYDIGCIAAGTQVLAGAYSKPIDSVSTDDEVTCLDRGVARAVDPNLGGVPRGRSAVVELELGNGRTVRLTKDHRVMTPHGWVEAGALTDGDSVLCSVFRGTPFEPFDLPPELIRVLAYVSGDGHLTRDGKAVHIYTTIEEDAEALRRDLSALGYRVGISRRERGPNRKAEINVRVASKHLHSRLADLGSPVGRKVWSRRAVDWLFESPRWVRATFLSAFASAEMTSPRLAGGCIANLAIKQRDIVAARFVADLLVSLHFRVSIAPSESCHVLQILGGEDEQIRFLEEVGFCLAVEKRRAAATCVSVAWQRRAHLLTRQAARLQALSMRSVGIAHRTVVAEVAQRFDVSPGFVHHAIYRTTLRRALGSSFAPATFGEGVWVPVADVVEAGTAEVWDIATGDPAESFLAEGIVVHNCGNKAAQTELTRSDLDELGGVAKLMDEISTRISFGMGVPAQERTDHPVLDRIRHADFSPQRHLIQLAANQLGTVGSGNHYVNLMEDEEGHVWVGVHFGSRGFGHKTASGFLALAEGLRFGDRAHEGEMDSPPVLFEIDSELGQSYVAAMELAGEYAYAGRDIVVAKVLEILGAEAVHEVHNHHNFAWREEHFGRTYWVIRKGCTPARPGQEGFVGGSMGDESVILEGVESDDNEQALYSTVHGAGRVMSRTQAAGKIRRRKRWACRNRDCDRVFDIDGISSSAGAPKSGVCPDHPDAGVKKVWVEEQLKPGVVDWPAVQARLREQGIVLVGGGADEAPEVYKRLPEVLAAHGETIRVKHTLRPLGVAMAGRNVHDPYKD
jgi:tRNA-splicing ligase RtcB (3'-phosphate/5'-hydroxy nucleic acid ligase)